MQSPAKVLISDLFTRALRRYIPSWFWHQHRSYVSSLERGTFGEEGNANDRSVHPKRLHFLFIRTAIGGTGIVLAQ